MMRGHTFVGMADDALALMQGGTRLFLLDVTALSRDLFYQQALPWRSSREHATRGSSDRLSSLLALAEACRMSRCCRPVAKASHSF